MSDVNKKLSGFQKRKRNKKKLQKEKELLRNVPKLDSFFASSRPSTSASASASGDWSDETDNRQPASVSDCDELPQIPQNLISENPAAVIGEDSGEHPESHVNKCFAISSFPSVSDDPAEWILDNATLKHFVQNGVKKNMMPIYLLRNASTQIQQGIYPFHSLAKHCLMVKYDFSLGWYFQKAKVPCSAPLVRCLENRGR